MIRCIADVVGTQIVIVHDDGHKTTIVPSDKILGNEPLFVGLIPDFHYVSLIKLQSQTDAVISGSVDDPNKMRKPSMPETDSAAADTPREPNAEHTTGQSKLQSRQYPECWSLEQWLSFSKEYPWLSCRMGCLGCSTCGAIKVIGPAGFQGVGVRNTLSSEWVNQTVASYGLDRADHLKSLRKKINEHKKSKAHAEAVKILQIRGEENFVTNIVDQQQHAWLASSNIFRTAYYLAKQNRPFTDHSSLVDLQRLNGVNVGRVLHSRTTCVDIIDHISDKMRKELTNSVVDSGVPFAVLIDESTTISNKTCLVVYLRCSVVIPHL